MAYDEELADRVRVVLAGADEKRMFGGLAFLLEGYMAVAVSGAGGLMLRVDPEQAEQLRTQPHTGPVVMRGREMRGWLRVLPAGVGTDEQLRTWIDRATALIRTLPPEGLTAGRRAGCQPAPRLAFVGYQRVASLATGR